MIQILCQWVILALNVFALFQLLKREVEGTPAKPATGYPGVVATIIAWALFIATNWAAGTFSRLWG